MKPIIKIENLSKQYRLGEVGTGTFSHDINRWWHKIRGKEDPYSQVGEENDRTTKGSSDYVWALKGVDFEVMPGEILGIIGKNGAGKSTLLKLLSRVTAPTTGTIEARGRIASLLEVGTGFHPELTGRENVYLNGAVLGMNKKEIEAKFDEIVSFAGCERYIDTPVKRYSSGMKVRLGFAVAAHLEPEILVVDEVLAVGDAEFQKKAIGKMQEVSEGQGRTVLFVSHNMASIQRLCTKTLVMENGTVKKIGNTKEMISAYLEQTKNEIQSSSIQREQISYPQPFIKKATIFNSCIEASSQLSFGEPFSVELEIVSDDNFDNFEPLIAVNTLDDIRIFTAISSDIRKGYRISSGTSKRIKADFNTYLTPGTYKITFALRNGRNFNYDVLFDALQITVSEHAFQNTVVNEQVAGLTRVYPGWSD